ncbi:MAG: tRNA(Ser) Um(44) 2'-O-methyltransferase [Bathelium mastoideum]|nr:MAG: tRNA(Ser) Um(44) 2'-O-methyltransferase [Bathelium mastoideum]
MDHLVHHPNTTSSYLFRADIAYDSATDHSAAWPANEAPPYAELTERARWMRAELRPRLLFSGAPSLGLRVRGSGEEGEGEEGDWGWERTWVRELVPRKPEVDARLAQSCHLFRSAGPGEGGERTLMVYVPHVERVEEVPFYHPAVRAIAFLHVWKRGAETEGGEGRNGERRDEQLSNDGDVVSGGKGTLSIHVVPFPETELQGARLDRTIRNLLQVLHKHGHGHMQGYAKRVHHDQLIGQKRYQDKYTRLKSKYARELCEGWAEVTDPRKHVFEDLGIAAFLICLWEDMYVIESRQRETRVDVNDGEHKQLQEGYESGEGIKENKRPFPGFVDIGCGNGVLVNLLIQEGWDGWGFDARRRKSWTVFPQEVRKRLEEKVLIPSLFKRALEGHDHKWGTNTASEVRTEQSLYLHSHDGQFPEGTFIISNHADELTGWTPLLARLSKSPFIAIPCCSHNLAGVRFRAPATGLRSQNKELAHGEEDRDVCEQPQNGSLRRRSKDASTQPSAYASLCSYLTNLAESMGYIPEKEVLRIPSTRNTAIIGRKVDAQVGAHTEQHIAQLVAAELRMPLEQAARAWSGRVDKMMHSTGNNH